MNRGQILEFPVQFFVEECCRTGCGLLFAITVDLKNQLLNSHDAFYCPAGHGQHYSGKSVEEKLRDQLAVRQRQLEDMDTRRRAAVADGQMAKHRERAQKAAKTRLKNRIAAGVCPCCTRSFENLQRHIKTKHPEFTGEEK